MNKLQERINRWSQCKICFTYGPYTKHHVKPAGHREKHTCTQKVKLCARCHSKVHEVFTHEQLASMKWVDTAAAIRKLINFIQ